MSDSQGEGVPFEMTNQIIGLVRSGALIVSFFLVVGWERKTWLKADAAAAGGFGLGFIFFPRQILEFQVEDALTSAHVQLGQMLGVMLLTSAFLVYLTMETRDGTVPVTIMMSRICMCGMLMLTQLFAHFWKPRGKKTANFNDQHLLFALLGTMLWFIGHVFHLICSTDFTSYPQHNVRINTNLHVDAFMTCLLSLALFAFPDFGLLQLYGSAFKMDLVQHYLVRSTAVILLSSALVGLQAPGFLHEDDKRRYFLTRIVGVGSFFCLLVVQHLYFQESQLGAMKYAACSLIPLFSNAVFGYGFAGSTISYRTYRTKSE